MPKARTRAAGDSTITCAKYNNRGCTGQAKNPQYLVENLLDRQFYAAKPNEKWLTDVTGVQVV